MTGRDSERQQILDDIARTYRSYRESGRQRLWDASNPGYSRIQRDRNAALVSLIRRSTTTGGNVLDVGCGSGGLADLVRMVMGDVSWTGVDLLPDAITEAREARPWARWIEASVDRLPLADASFDVVVASTLFSSLPTSELEHRTAAEIARVIKPGGWVVWYDLRYDNPRNSAVHGLTPSAVSRLFPNWRIELASITLLPPLARRLGMATPVLYPVLHALAPLRSHLVGRLQRTPTAIDTDA